MTSIQTNYPINQTVAINSNKPVQAQQPEKVVENKSAQVATMPATIPTYNVKVPMSFSHVEDIKLPNDLTAKCYKLANGQRVVIVPKDGPTFVKTYVNTGSFNEPDNLRGISHYIEHNLFNGSEDLGDKVFFDEVHKMGGSTNASTSFANTDYYIKSNLLEDGDLETKIQLHAGMLQSPKFLVDKLEKEKKIVNSEINMCLSDNENIGYSQTVKNLFNIKSSSIDLVAGNTDNISSLTQDDVVKYFNNNYYPANMTTVITGEVEPQKTMELVSKYFNSTKVPTGERHFEKMTLINHPVRQDIISPKSESNSTSIFLGFAGPENNNTVDKVHLQAMNYLAGGLKNSRTSKLERNYGVGISFAPDRLSSRPQDHSLMLVETIVPENKSEQFIKDLYAVIDNLAKVPPTDDEFMAIKNKMKKSNEKTFEYSGGVNNAIGNAYLNDNIKKLNEFDKIVDSMTKEDVMNAAKKYLDLNKVALTVVHPHGTDSKTLDSNYDSVKQANVSFTGSKKSAPIDVSKVKTYRAANNFEIQLNETNSDNVEYSFTMGEKDWTPKKAAVADVLSEVVFNSGTKSKSVEDISKFEDKYGISSSGVSVGDMGLTLTADFPIQNAKQALENFNDQIKNPNINQQEFDKAIARLKDYYKGYEVSPYDALNKLLYKGTPREFTPQDKLESLDLITLEDVKNLYSEFFKNGQGEVTVSAPFSKHPELKQEIFNSVCSFAPVKPWDTSIRKFYKPIEKTEVFTAPNRKNQAQIVKSYTFQHNGNLKDEVCLNLLNAILGDSPASRLFSDLREQRHLAYSVYSNYNLYDDMGEFVLSIGTTTENHETGEKSFDNIKKSIDGFNENIEKITTEKVSEEELENAKKEIKNQLYNSFEDNSSKNEYLKNAHKNIYGINRVNESLAMLDSITVDDIYNTARNVFRSKPVYSITATQASLDANKEFLNSLNS